MPDSCGRKCDDDHAEYIQPNVGRDRQSQMWDSTSDLPFPTVREHGPNQNRNRGKADGARPVRELGRGASYFVIR